MKTYIIQKIVLILVTITLATLGTFAATLEENSPPTDPTATSENENIQKVETWMFDINFWNNDLVEYRVVGEKKATSSWLVSGKSSVSSNKTDCEQWMLDYAMWLENIDLSQSDTELWMTDYCLWLDKVDLKKTDTEQWMTDYLMWMEKVESASGDVEFWMNNISYWAGHICLADCSVETWMNDPNYWE